MLSVVIAAFQDDEGLYLTLHNVLQQLRRLDYLAWEVVVAADGGTEQKFEKLQNVRVLRIRTGSPQGTRTEGIKAAQYQNVLCLESHVVVSDIGRFLDLHILANSFSNPQLNSAISFPCRISEGSEMYNVYGSEVDWGGKLWFKKLLYDEPPQSDNAFGGYPVAQFGHSCFMIDRSWFLESGGYTDLLTGWGGEEPYLCLKAWMLGRSCWLFPQIWHAHYLIPGAHGTVMQSQQFENNFKIIKYLLNGTMFPGCHQPAIQAERERIKAGPFHGSLEELREHFRKTGVIN